MEAEVKPYAHQWHLLNAYVPLDVIHKMNELGVFGLTIPEEFGGLGLGKEAMCVVSEELSRGYIGVGWLDAHGDRRGADPWRRHAGAKGALAAEAR